MKIDELKELIKLVSDSNIRFFEFEQDSVKIKMNKDAMIIDNKEAQDDNIINEYNTSSTKQESMELRVENVKEIDNKNIKEVKSPMVGTFYTSTSPESTPLVKVGSRVNKGDIICIIEAMKIMNEIEAEVNGIVTEVLVKNEQMVQYGETLIRIEEC